MALRLRQGALACLFATATLGCGGPVPQDKLDYIGHWEGGGATLDIAADGGLSYRLIKGSSETEYQGPILEFRPDAIVIGIPVVNSTITVQQPPTLEDGEWSMVTDDVRIFRTP